VSALSAASPSGADSGRAASPPSAAEGAEYSGGGGRTAAAGGGGGEGSSRVGAWSVAGVGAVWEEGRAEGWARAREEEAAEVGEA